MSKQSRGHCRYCQAEYTKGGMIRHLSACKQRAAEFEKEKNVKETGYFTLSITDKYDKRYWLIIECKENATLQDVDQFLRDIWLECCGHLSSFYIDETYYESDRDGSDDWGMPSKNMDTKIKNVLEKGMKIEHVYDFGSSTELVITVSDYRVSPLKKNKITLMARNNPVEYLCSHCSGKIARYICAECIYDGEGYLCEDCAAGHECGEDMLLAICNSPRCGVCGYQGSPMYGD